PRDNVERLALCEMCYETKRFAAAARFWTEAMSAEPKRFDRRDSPYRYNAACAAALAAAGQGTDTPRPDDAERAKLRSQALGWLQAELATSVIVLEEWDPQARSRMVQRLEHWRVDTDLAWVRDPGALAKLPETERTAWKSLWAEVDALLARAREVRR